jgi:hypothetical protein
LDGPGRHAGGARLVSSIGLGPPAAPRRGRGEELAGSRVSARRSTWWRYVCTTRAMQRGSFGDGSLTSARVVYVISKRRDWIALAAAAMVSAPFVAMLAKPAPVTVATEALPLGIPVILSPEYVTMDPPCCDLMRRPHCELSDACYGLLCKEIPTRNPYTMGRHRHLKGMDVYDVANFTSSSPHVVFIPSSPVQRSRSLLVVPDLNSLAELVSPEDCDEFIKHGSEHLKRSVTFVDEATGEMKPTTWRTSHDSGVPPNPAVPFALDSRLLARDQLQQLAFSAS